jgi:hypothetical protein
MIQKGYGKEFRSGKTSIMKEY